MTARRSLSPLQRLKVFEAAKGVCHLCEQRIQVGQPWEVEHVRPLALGGADDESNMRPAHKACHAGKTKTDAASWSKAKRCAAKHNGIKKASRMPGSRNSKWKAKIGGGWELR